uniref:Peptidase M14 carboxypeptidase A domain-containing protein n=1 Tax=Panagrolaimus sp. JU765 TaxID=591449 RepID=A0AC34RK66_9BILA
MVSPEKRAEVTIYLKKAGLVPLIKIADVGKLVAADKRKIDTYQRNLNLANDPDSFDFYKYHPFTEMMVYIEAVAAKYSSFVSIATLGPSAEGRDIKYLKIGYPSQSKKNALFIDAGIHAREWIAPATALYTINQLVTNSSFTDLLKAIDIYIAPSINPDGYEYSRDENRMWRKSRSVQEGCYGVDLNRNFDFQWMASDPNIGSCSATYSGPFPLSEIEAVNLANFILSHNDTIKAYLTFHSYGQEIVYPWGYAIYTYPPDVGDLNKLANVMEEAISDVHGNSYFIGSSADVLYPIGGASDDYSKFHGIKYVYTIELRDIGISGFDLPEEEIKPTGEEIFPALLAVADKVQNGPF